MPRSKLLASVFALALGDVTAVQAQSFSGVITFGDSLSDTGNVAALFGAFGVPPGYGFTTNPDPVYADLVAAAFGFGNSSYSPYIAGSTGNDYAVGGACVSANSASFTCINDPSGAAGKYSITGQLGGYLADPARGGRADPNALYLMWGGGNDLSTAATDPATALANADVAATAMVGLIGTLQNAGARTIVVFNLFDGGLTPRIVGTSNQAGASALTAAYNDSFNAGLADLGDGIVPINVFGLFNEVVADPGRYGLSNVTGSACGALSLSVFCGAVGSGLPYTYAPGSGGSYLFADPGGHPAGAAHALLAQVVLATLSAPGQVSMAGELPLQTYDDHSQTINDRLFAVSNAAPAIGARSVYGALHYGRQQFAASSTSNAMDNDQITGTFGVDVRRSEAVSLGAAVSFGDGNGDSGGAAVDGRQFLLSAYGSAGIGAGYVDAIVSGGRSQLDIERRIVLGPGLRRERGRTHADHRALELGGGFAFGSGAVRHGPYARLTWQQIEVAGYAEAATDSTALHFGDFRRDSLVARLGYQAQGQCGRWQPYGRVAYARENHDGATVVQAGANTMNGHFRLDGFQPARDWFEADVGAEYRLSERSVLLLRYRARLGDDRQDLDAVDLGLRLAF